MPTASYSVNVAAVTPGGEIAEVVMPLTVSRTLGLVGGLADRVLAERRRRGTTSLS